MFAISPGTRLITDPATGRGSLVTGTGTVVVLNRTAVIAFQAIEETGAVHDAQNALHEHYPTVPEQQLRQDIDTLLGVLIKQRAVTAA